MSLAQNSTGIVVVLLLLMAFGGVITEDQNRDDKL